MTVPVSAGQRVVVLKLNTSLNLSERVGRVWFEKGPLSLYTRSSSLCPPSLSPCHFITLFPSLSCRVCLVLCAYPPRYTARL